MMMYVTHIPRLLKKVELGFGSLWATPTFMSALYTAIETHQNQQLTQYDYY